MNPAAADPAPVGTSTGPVLALAEPAAATPRPRSRPARQPMLIHADPEPPAYCADDRK